MMKLERDGDIFTLTLCNGENRFNLEFIESFQNHLDEVASATSQGPGALVIAGEGKFWTNGIDLEFLAKAPPAEQGAFLPALNGLLGRLLCFPVPTAAAINGHAFAGGAILAMALDYRVMRTERGWFCLPEIDIEIPFPASMIALLRSRMPESTLRDAILGGKRYTGEEALAAGIVDAVCDVEQLQAQAVEILMPLSTKSRSAYGKFKKDLYGELAAEFGYGV